MRHRSIVLTAGAFGLLAGVSYLGFVATASHQVAAEAAPAPPAKPSTLELTGIVRDFRERGVSGGHPDFERRPDNGFGHYAGNISPLIGENGKPRFVGGGAKITRQWRDSLGRPIFYRLFDAARGDVRGTFGGADTGSIETAASFNLWYQDVPGVNMSAPLSITLNLQPDGSYVFDDKLDPFYLARGGFFPVDNQMFGNSAGTPNHNFHFTYELHTLFTYDDAAKQIFRFIGDDDVWVFIDGRLVIDIGGVHAAVDQFVEVDRLGLEDGKTYSLDFFFAERHRVQSNFRINTNIVLTSPPLPTITSSYD